MVFLVFQIINFLVLALLLGTVVGYLLSRSMVKEVRTSVEQLKIDVAGNRKRLGAAETDLTLHKSSLNELRAAYDGLQERLSVHSDRQADLSGQMEGLVAARSALSERTATLASQLTEAQAALGRQLEAIQQSLLMRIEGLSTDRDAHGHRLFALEEATERLTGAHQAHAKRVDDLVNLAGSSDMADSAAPDSVLQFADRVSHVESRLEAANQALSASHGQLGDLSTRHDEVEQRVERVRAQLEVLAEADNVLSARLESVAGLPLRLTGLDDDHQDLVARVNALETIPLQLESARAQVEHVQTAAAALTSRVDHQDRWGQEAEDRLEALESRLASRDPDLRPVASAAVPAPTQPELLASNEDKPNDNLKRIRGIGVVLERLLNEAGIRRFEQIASWTDEDVERFSRLFEKFQGRIMRDNWVAQAKALLGEKGTSSEKSRGRGKQKRSAPSSTAEW